MRCLAFAVLPIVQALAVGGVRRPRVGPNTLPITWSNPLGTVLTQIHDDVWLAERPFFPTLPGLGGVDVGGKMAVVRLPSGALWVHSPVELDAPLQTALDALGPVSHVCTPNTEHQKWAAQWLLAYPDAIGYTCPGLRERRPEVGWSVTLGDGGIIEAPPAWEGALDFVHIADRWPLGVKAGSFFDEVVFCHRPSRTLFCADLWWNYPWGSVGSAGGTDVVPSFATRLWKLGMDVVYRPVYNRLMTTGTTRDALACVLQLDFDGIAPCHGEPIATGGKALLARHLALEPS